MAEFPTGFSGSMTAPNPPTAIPTPILSSPAEWLQMRGAAERALLADNLATEIRSVVLRGKDRPSSGVKAG